MKRCIILLLSFLFFSGLSFTQTLWQYDFGTTTGSFTTANSTSTFLPDPPAGNDLVRIGDLGGGFELLNPLGTDSELQITASSGSFDGRVNKFSIIDYTQSKVFSIMFSIRLSYNPADTGSIYFFIGDGNYFSDNTRYTGGNVFAGVRWQKKDANATTALLNNVLPDSWFNINSDVSSETIVTYELFGNNSSNTQFYNYNGSSAELPPYNYSLYINGALINTYLKGIAPILGDDQNIDSFMFLAEGSPLNQYKIAVDDFYYSNELIAGPLPVELSLFTGNSAGKNINLNWRTETEVNNYGFEVERTSPLPSPYKGEGGGAGRGWERIGFVNGNGNSNSPKTYSFIDNNPISGSRYLYRLKQIDNDGQFAYSDVVEVQMDFDNFSLSQNFPNPFNPVTSIQYIISSRQFVSLKVFDVLGKEIATLVNEEKSSGQYQVEFKPESNILHPASGVYFYRLQAGSFVETKRMILLK